LEDGTSWPLLLSRYRLSGQADLGTFGADAILRRRAVPGTFALQALSAGDYAIGKPVALPVAAAVLWAEIDVEPSLAGRICAVLYKTPPLWITYYFPNGVVAPYRYIAGMGVTGFVISPIVGSVGDFLALAQGAPGLPRPVSFVIGPGGATSWLLRPVFHMRLYALTFPAG
jgi:hypothetical protein